MIKISSNTALLHYTLEETPDTNISDTSNELKQVLAHSCFYISGKAKTYINFTPI